MRLFTYGYGHCVREVVGSRLGRGTEAGGVFHPARQLAMFCGSITDHIHLPHLRLPATLKTAISAIIIIFIIIFELKVIMAILDKDNE